jgi:hypothetical protein
MSPVLTIPSSADVPDEQRRVERVSARFDDFCQDGRVQLTSVAQAAQPVVWGHLGNHPGLRALWGQGIIPVLARLVVEAEPGAFTPAQPFTVATAYRFAHVAASDEVERLLVLIWGDVSGQRGPLFAPSKDAAPARCGRFFAEVVFTRLFAPPSERKVVRFAAPGLPAIPEHRYVAPTPDAIVALPDGAVALEPSAAPDAAAIAFGLCHTDVNQHVGSFVYPRLFEEAALRRFAALGVAAPGLARAVELGYRRPFRAGERARLGVQAFTLGEGYGAVGVFVRDGDDEARAGCYVKMIFER